MKKKNEVKEATDKIQKAKLFNPDGSDALEDRKIINGNPTNLFNLNNVKFSWGNKLYRSMMDNFWIPEKVNLTNDRVDYEKMTQHEQRAYNGILSFLVFLDSIIYQTLLIILQHQKLSFH